MINALSDINELTLNGMVTYILSASTNGSIFHIESVDGNASTTYKIKADSNIIPNPPSVGEVWRITGYIETHPQYGSQLIAVDAYRSRPTGNIITKFIANNNRFVGVGDKKAKHLWSVFGENLYEILDKKNISRLIDKNEGALTYNLANNIIEAWHYYADETPVIEWLNKYNFPLYLATKVRSFWGKDTIIKLLSNPYRMLAFSSWKKVDDVAKTLGISKEDDRRQLAALESVLYDHYDKGNTAAILTNLNIDFSKKTGISSITPDIINKAIDNNIIKILDNGLCQSLGAYALEKIITKRLMSLAKKESHQNSLFDSEFDEVKLSNFETLRNIKLNSQQKAAIETILNNNLCCIKGGAGVGKTTVLEAVFDQIGKHTVIYQVALTGRAAKRMMEATQYEAKTIASFLIQAKDYGVQENSYLFIDESSMIDVPTLYKLLKVLPNSVRVCFIGDHYQLPPIGPGLAFKVISESKIIPNVELSITHRFAKESEIIPVASSIRSQNKNITLDSFCGLENKAYGVSFIDASTDKEIINKAATVYREFNEAGNVQILCPTNKLCEHVNIFLHNEHIETRKYLKKPTPLTSNKSYSMTVDDPLLYHSKNNYEKELFNGSLGKLLEVYDNPLLDVSDDGELDKIIAVADFDNGNIVQLTQSDFDNINLGYGITVHKSQGSQFQRVIILCPKSKIIDNTWLYTAITRATTQVCIIGDRKTFIKESSSQPKAFERRIGMNL